MLIADKKRRDNLTVEETYEILKNVLSFNKQCKKHLYDIAEHSRYLKLEKGQFVIHKGDRCKGIYVIVRGTIKVSFLSMEGKEYVVNIIGSGQTFAEAMTFLKKPSPVTIQTITKAEVLLLPSELIFKCINTNPACACNMLAILSQRLYLLDESLESVTLDSGQQRTIGFLLQHLHVDSGDYNRATITLGVSKAMIASHINLTPETFSKILHQLSEKGLISIFNKTIDIHNIKQLTSLSYL